MTNETASKIVEVLKKARETAAMDFSSDVDIEELSSEEMVMYATLSRLHRVVDKNFDRIVNDHVTNITSVVTADKAVDVYTQDYFLDLPVSYNSLSRLAEILSAAVKKYGVSPPKSWGEMACGNFPFQTELEDRPMD